MYQQSTTPNPVATTVDLDHATLIVVTWRKADASFPDKHGTQLRKLGGTECTSEIDSTAIQ